jgi:hypothetical protein
MEAVAAGYSIREALSRAAGTARLNVAIAFGDVDYPTPGHGILDSHQEMIGGHAEKERFHTALQLMGDWSFR